MASTRRLNAPPDIHDYSKDPPGDFTNLDDWAELDFAALFPVPKRHIISKRKRTAKQPQDSDDGDQDDSFWLSPRMAFKLHDQAFQLAYHCQEEATKEVTLDPWMLDTGGDLPSLPRIARPYAKQKWVGLAYAECFRRVGARLAKGHPPSPNCTGEEMALHQIIYVARELDEDGNFEEGIAHLPATRVDEDYDMMEDLCFQDADVLMLYDMKGVACLPNPAHLHPSEWFFAFQNDRVQDHLPGTAWRDPKNRLPMSEEEVERAREEVVRLLDAQEALWARGRGF